MTILVGEPELRKYLNRKYLNRRPTPATSSLERSLAESRTPKRQAEPGPEYIQSREHGVVLKGFLRVNQFVGEPHIVAVMYGSEFMNLMRAAGRQAIPYRQH